MSFVQRSLVVAGVFFLCQLAVARADDGKEPEADGKPLSHWLKQLDDPDKRLEAIDKVKQIATDSDFNAKGVVDKLIGCFQKDEQNFDDVLLLRAVMETFADMKSKDESKRAVIPLLRKYVRIKAIVFRGKGDEKTKEFAGEALGEMTDNWGEYLKKNPNCEEQLHKALDDEDIEVQSHALLFLGKDYYHSKTAIAKLKKIARSDNERLSNDAKIALNIAEMMQNPKKLFGDK